MVLVNAATGAPISAPTANSLSGTMTTQSTNSASLPAGISVQQLLQQAQQLYPELPCIIITAHSDLENAVAAYKHGAFEYLPKPFDIDDVTSDHGH